MSTENVLKETSENELKFADSTENFDIEKIKGELSGIEKQYASEYPSANPDESTMPQYKDNTPKTYDEIVSDAKESLGEYQVSNLKEIEDKYTEKLDNLELKEQKVNTEVNNDIVDLVTEKEQNLEQNQANMISQGLERSSIAQNTENNINAQFDQDLVRLIEEKQISISEIELKRAMIQNDMNIALEKFDIAYASKLESKFEELTQKYNAEMIALEKYNTRIAELRNERNQEWAKWVKQKTTEIDATISRKKVEYLVNTIKTLSREEALELMRDQEIIDSLGDYYQIVLDFANRRR